MLFVNVIRRKFDSRDNHIHSLDNQTRHVAINSKVRSIRMGIPHLRHMGLISGLAICLWA